MVIYTVKSGDTVSNIAASFHINPDTIIYDNQLVPPYTLLIGQALLLNNGISEETARPPLLANGYAYPYISQWVLTQTLPFLSDLSIFSYGFTTQGELVLPSQDDSWMIALAKDTQVRPMLTLTPLDEQGRFNNHLIRTVLQNNAALTTLISGLLDTIQRMGYGGVDVDFEYIPATERDAFSAFVETLHNTLSPYGYRVTTALAPKTSADQPGLLYEGKDYAALGAASDSVLLMTYEWGYKYGPNMAIAPIQMVRRVVEYAVTEIPSQKIHLGIPNYGYDWPLPFVANETVARTIGNVEAIQIALEHGSEIQFDEFSQSPFFRYTENGIEHEVWFEDVRSLYAKCQLIKEFQLSGIGIWQIMRWWRAGYLLFQNQFFIQ